MIKYYVHDQESKNRILQQSKYLKDFKIVGYSKKRGHKKTYLLDTDMTSLLVDIHPDTIVVDTSYEKGWKITVSSEEEKNKLVEQSDYIHYWCEELWLKRKAQHGYYCLDSDKCGTLMHIYLLEDNIIVE
jgi:hypothetical protein